MTYEEIMSELRNKIYRPVYFLQGEEPYFIDKISDYIQQNILSEGERSFNQTILYGKDVEARTLIDILMRYPMMSNYQVVILKEAQQMRNIEDLEKYIKNPVKTTVFVINYKYKKLDKRTKFWKEAVSKQCFFESEKIYDNQLPAFIRQIVKEHEHQIEDKAVETLAEYLGNDLSKIENEVSKLMLNVPKNEIINNAHIEKYIGISREYNIFELQKALAHKNKKKAYQIAEYYVKNSKEYPPFVITGMLNSFFTKALQYQSYQNQQEAKKAMFLNYFQEQDLKEYSKKYSRIQTGKIFDLLLQYDLKMKGVGYAQSEKEPLLKELIYRILNV